MQGDLYFHSPCFDGIASAVVTWDFLEAWWGWSPVELRAVNYGARDDWLSRSLGPRAAVVDFLYHPDAAFWADHHPTAFLTAESEGGFRQRRERAGERNDVLVYEPDASSCAGLLWRHLWETLDHRNERYRELVDWADKIDAARYASVHEALFSREPAARIDLSLALASADDCVELVGALRRESLEAVAALRAVEDRYARARQLMDSGLERFRAGARLMSDGIVVFDVESDADVLIPRYAPYYFFPDARYSAGIIRKRNRARITAMRNPWRDFESVPLGGIFRELGGGGHARVGSVVLGEKASEATCVLDRVLSAIRREQQLAAKG